METGLMEWRKKCGFLREEIQHFRETCDKFKEEDDPGDGSIKLEKVIKVLAELGRFGGKFEPLSDGERESLTRALLRVDREQKGRIGFEDLLLLLRHLRNRRCQMTEEHKE